LGPKQITEEVFQVGGAGMTAGADAAVYMVQFGGQAALIDAGSGAGHDRLLENILSCGVGPDQIQYLLLTHCHFDHTGGCRQIKETTGCRIVAHELEAPFLEKGDDTVTAAAWYGASLDPLEVDFKISGEGGRIPLGDRDVTAIFTPGHSPGSMVYMVDSQGQKVLFAQDVHGPLDESLLSNPADYRKSLGRLISLDADILCEGHYGVFTGREEVNRFIQSFR
jgi:glyoxylase-like metal-dependent hydrolase (beta-lactamase superfamily II)